MHKKTLLNHEFTTVEMIKVLKNSKNYTPICRMFTQHLCDMLDVAICKLELLIKHNREFDQLIAEGSTEDKLQNLEALCERSRELYQEIEHLPIMQEDSESLIDLLTLSKAGSRYSDLLELLYKHKEIITSRVNPFMDMTHLHMR